MERQWPRCRPPSPLPANVSSPFDPPSAASLALFVFLSESSSPLLSLPPPFPLVELNSEGEEEREERTTGWNPCCKKKKRKKKKMNKTIPPLFHECIKKGLMHQYESVFGDEGIINRIRLWCRWWLKITSNKQAATFIYGSSSSLSVTLSLHLRSMEPSGQESSDWDGNQRVRLNQPGNKE